jgi:cytidylate kinase
MKSLLIDQCSAYLLAHAVAPPARDRSVLPAVAISRETGAGAVTIGQLVAEYLMSKQDRNARYPWAVFDRDMVKKVLEDHKLPEALEKYMPEDAMRRVHDYLEDMCGVHPPSSTLVEHTNHTILKLAMAGNVILVGRGAHLITAHLPHVFHVRLVAPLEFRIRHSEKYYHLNHQEAADYVRNGDRAKVRYLRRNFESQIHSPLQFHITINTGLSGFTEIARLIGDAVLNMRTH